MLRENTAGGGLTSEESILTQFPNLDSQISEDDIKNVNYKEVSEIVNKSFLGEINAKEAKILLAYFKKQEAGEDKSPETEKKIPDAIIGKIKNNLEIPLHQLDSDDYGPDFAIANLLALDNMFTKLVEEYPDLTLDEIKNVKVNIDSTSTSFNDLLKQATFKMREDGKEPIIPPEPGSTVQYKDFISEDSNTIYKFMTGTESMDEACKRLNMSRKELNEKCDLVVKGRGGYKIGAKNIKNGDVVEKSEVATKYRLKEESKKPIETRSEENIDESKAESAFLQQRLGEMLSTVVAVMRDRAISTQEILTNQLIIKKDELSALREQIQKVQVALEKKALG